MEEQTKAVAKEPTKQEDAKSRLSYILKIFAKHHVIQSLAEQKNAEQVRGAFEELGPTFIKIGQILSTRADILTPEFAMELKKLQDNVKTDSYESVEQTIQEETGHTVEEVFETFSKTPLASASMAQVHAATLKGGQRVVVKVQHPGIYDKMSMDLELLEKAVVLTKYIPIGGMVDPGEIVRELKNSLLDELDFTKEADNIEQFGSCNADVPYILAPKVYRSFSSKRILVMDFMQGVQIAKYIDQSDKEVASGNTAVIETKKRLAKEIINNYLKQVFDDGFFHADPHPGNILITLDQGAVPQKEVAQDGQAKTVETVEKGLLDELPLDIDVKIAGVSLSTMFRNQDVLGLFAGKATASPSDHGSERIVYIDFGMMGVIDKPTLKKFNNILAGIYQQDSRKTAKGILSLCKTAKAVDLDAFTIGVERILDQYCEMSLGEMSLRAVFQDVKDVCEKHGLQLPSCVTLLLKGIGTIEGIVLSLDPECSIMSVLKPYAKAYIKKQFDPQKEMLLILKDLYRAGKSMPEIPVKTSRALDTITKGEIKLNMDMDRFEGLFKRVEAMVNRLIMGFIVAALIIGSSLLIHFGQANTAVSTLGIVGYVLAILIVAIILIKTYWRRK